MIQNRHDIRDSRKGGKVPAASELRVDEAMLQSECTQAKSRDRGLL